MKTWTSEGHLTDHALELRAADEAGTLDVGAIDRHLRGCPACRAREAEWRGLFDALQALPRPQPDPSFDDAVMARVRRPPAAAEAETSWLPRLARKLRPIAVGVAALWSGAVIGGIAWGATRVDVSAAAVATQALASVREVIWAGVMKIAAALHLSGLVDLWARAAEVVPGPGVLSAVAVMTAMSGLAIWMLLRVTGFETRMKAHV